jgi:hypothetical protein
VTNQSRANPKLPFASLPTDGEKPLHIALCSLGPQQPLEQIGFINQTIVQRLVCTQDRLFGEAHSFDRKRRDAARKPINERTDLVRFEDAVQITPGFRRLGIEVVSCQNDFKRTPATNEARQPLRAGAPRQNAKRHLHLIDDGLAAYTKAHVEACGQFTATPAHAAFDLRDRDLVHGPEALAHLVIEIKLGITLRLGIGRKAQNRAHIEMREEKIRVCALQHDDGQIRIILQFDRKRRQLGVQLERDDVDRRIADGHGSQASFLHDA